MLYIRYPLSLRQVENMLFERDIDVCYEPVRYGWNHFGPLFAAEIRTRRVRHGSYSLWRWYLDEVFVRINGKTCYVWRAVDHEGEVLEVFVTKRRDSKATLRFLKRTMQRYVRPASTITDKRQSYRAAMKVIDNEGCQEAKRWLNNPFEGGKGQWRGSETSRPYRNSPPSMPLSTTISTTNAISLAALFSNKPEPPPWPSGVNLQPERPVL